jgi:hypothetical protein
MKWTKYCKFVLIIESWMEIWIVSSSPVGVLDGMARFSSLSRYLVSRGRQVPPKVCYFGRFCHR